MVNDNQVMESNTYIDYSRGFLVEKLINKKETINVDHSTKLYSIKLQGLGRLSCLVIYIMSDKFPI